MTPISPCTAWMRDVNLHLKVTHYINLITIKPDYEEVTGKVGFTYGDYNLTRFRGALNLPLSPNMAARASLVWAERDGCQENVGSGVDGDDDEFWVLRGGLRWVLPNKVALYW